MATRMQQRRGTAAQWTSADPILEAGEIGFEIDTNKFKIGDGVNHWEDLIYYASAADLAALVDNAPGLLNTLNEIAAAIGDDPNFITTIGDDIQNAVTEANNYTDGVFSGVATAVSGAVDAHNSDTTSVHGIADTANLATKSYADNAVSTAVSNHSNDTTSIHGIDDTANLATKTYADSAVSTHSSDTTSVHGISDTANLVYQTDLSSHSSDTTNIHGISDTSALVTLTGTETLSNKTLSSPTVTIGSALATATYSDISSIIGLNGNNFTVTVFGHAFGTAAADAPNGTILVITNAGPSSGSYPKVGFAGGASSFDVSGNGQFFLANLTDANFVLGSPTTISSTEISYLDGVTSAIQTQLDAKASSSDLSTHASDTTNIHGIADTSALVTTDGGQSISGTTTVNDLVIGGALTFTGTATQIDSTNTTLADPMIYLGDGNSADIVDLGFVGAFDNGTYQHAGLVRDASDSTWKLFSGVTDEPTNTVNFGQGQLDTLAVGGVKFSDGTQTKEGVPSRTPIISKTGSYTLSALTERDSLIEVDSSSPVTITIPTNSAVAFPVGTTLDILGVNTGLITIAGDTGVTVNATPGLKLRTQWSSCTLFKRAIDSWVVYGDLKA